MRRTLAALAAAALISSGAAACGTPTHKDHDCRPRVVQTAAKHRPPGGGRSRSGSRTRSKPKTKPAAPVHAPPAVINRSACHD